MPHRYKSLPNRLFPLMKLRPCAAVRERLKLGYGWQDLRTDMMSGAIVAMVAIPLSMALAIASGVAPQYGLYTAIVGGGLVALLGGSRFQVTGPTAAFVVILAPIAQKFGFAGLLIAGFMAGAMLTAMAIAKMGKLIQYIPHPVTTGFTSGIAVVIATLQFKDFFGLKVGATPDTYLEKLWALLLALPTISLPDTLAGVWTLAILIYWPKFNRKIPAPLVALGAVSVLMAIIKAFFPDLNFATIGNHFSFTLGGVSGHGIPQAPPTLHWPWELARVEGQPFKFDLPTFQALAPSAFAITMLGAIESLLSAVVADGMAQTKHDPDAELLALGIGNMICPFFGGIPATGAIARTATNIRFGATSPFSSMFHALFVLLVILLFAPLVSYLPMASLAALLIVVAWNMAQKNHFAHIVRVAPRSDVTVLLICFSLTVLFDMVVGVSVGMVLAAFLFMRRMAEVTEGHRLTSDKIPNLVNQNIPHDVVVYEIAGPFFFGAAEKAASMLTEITDNIRGVIFVMNEVPVMDVSGLVAFESAVHRLANGKRKIGIVGLRHQPELLIRKSEMIDHEKNVAIYLNIETALQAISV